MIFKKHINITEDNFFEAYVGVPKEHLLYGKKPLSIVPKSSTENYKDVFKRNKDLASIIVLNNFYSTKNVNEHIKKGYGVLKENFNVPFSLSYSGKNHWNFTKSIPFSSMTSIMDEEVSISLITIEKKIKEMCDFMNLFITFNKITPKDVLYSIVNRDKEYITEVITEMYQFLYSDNISDEKKEEIKESMMEKEKEKINELLSSIESLFSFFMEHLEEITKKLPYTDYKIDLVNLCINVSELNDDYWYFGFTNRLDPFLSNSILQGLDEELLKKYTKYDLTEEEVNEWVDKLSDQLKEYQKNKDVVKMYKDYFLETEQYEKLIQF